MQRGYVPCHLCGKDDHQRYSRADEHHRRYAFNDRQPTVIREEQNDPDYERRRSKNETRVLQFALQVLAILALIFDQPRADKSQQ